MHNIAPSRALERRSRDLLKVALLFVLGGGFVGILGLSLFIVNLVVPSNPGYQDYVTVRSLMLFGGMILGLVGLGLALRSLTWKTDNPLADSTGKALSTYLDARYTFIRNVSKQAVGYIDALLIGPPGILVFRILDREGIYFNEGGRWLKQRDKGDWQPIGWNPTREVVEDIKKLRQFLTLRGLQEVQVYGVIVFSKEAPLAQFSVKEPVVPVVHIDELSYRLSDSYFAKDRVDEKTVAQLVHHFSA